MSRADHDEDREELLRMDRAQRRNGACRCFGHGEAGGTCPGPANCPINDGDLSPSDLAEIDREFGIERGAA